MCIRDRIQADVILDTLKNFNTEEGNALFLCDQSGKLVEGNDNSIMEEMRVCLLYTSRCV